LLEKTLKMLMYHINHKNQLNNSQYNNYKSY